MNKNGDKIKPGKSVIQIIREQTETEKQEIDIMIKIAHGSITNIQVYAYTLKGTECHNK